MASRQPSSKTNTIKSRLFGLLKWLVVAVVLVGITGVAGVAGLFYYYGRDLPELMEREDYDPPELSQVFTSNGELIAEFHTPGERRTLIDLEDIPTDVQKAFLAAEDSDFMQHDGIDYLGMVRAVYFAFRYDQGMRGTSTITQQLIKNIVLTPERAYERKIQEIILARELEQNLSKEDILYMYLNTIYLGHGNNGIVEAARFYFGKTVDELDVEEAALLAGMTAGPEGASPLRNMERAKQRRAYVLRQMWENGWINEGTYREGIEADIETQPLTETHPYLGTAPYFTEYIRQHIRDEYGSEALFTGGLRIHTTLDLEKQQAAERAARAGLRDYDQRRDFFKPVDHIEEDDIDDYIDDQVREIGSVLQATDVYEAVVTDVDDGDDPRVQARVGPYSADLIIHPETRILGEGSDRQSIDEAFERGDIIRVHPTATVSEDSAEPIDIRFETSAEAAVISLDPMTREIKAMVGGYDFETSEYNHAIQARRQTGSAFKTLVYAGALEERLISPASVYLDSPTVFQMHDGNDWSPRNADGEWRGSIRVREALASSRNVVAVRVLDDLGVDRAIEFSRRIGVDSPMVENHTMVMGSGEMPPIELTNVYATFASQGQFAEPRFLDRIESARGDRERFQTHTEPVLAPEVAYLTTSLLESAVSGYVDSNGDHRGGTGHTVSQVGHPIAGKTGTTNDTRDAWFIGYTPDLVTGVWVGFSDNRSLGPREYGGRLAGPIFRRYKEAILEDRDEPLEFEEPTSGITTAVIDPITGKLSRGDGLQEKFLVGTAPTEYAPQDDEDTGENFFLDQFQ